MFDKYKIHIYQSMIIAQLLFIINCGTTNIASNLENIITVQTSCSTFPNPKSLADCSQFSSSNTYCCVVNPIVSTMGTTQCYELPVSAYNGQSYINYQNAQYSMDCGQSKYASVLPPCGNMTNPTGKNDCSNFSTDLISCCYFSGISPNGLTTYNPAVVNASCVSLGTKYRGSTTIAGMPLDCSSNYPSISLIITFLILLISFFL